MEPNSLFNYNKIKEIEENSAISPPSSLSSEKRNSFSFISLSTNKKDNNKVPLSACKSKSYKPLLKNHYLYDIYLCENNVKNHSNKKKYKHKKAYTNKKKSKLNNIDNNTIYHNTLNNTLKSNKDDKDNNKKKHTKHSSYNIYKNNTSIFKNNDISKQQIVKNVNISNSEESLDKVNINFNINSYDFQNKKILKRNNINITYNVFNNTINKNNTIYINNKINPCTERLNGNGNENKNENENDNNEKTIKQNKSSRILYPKNNEKPLLNPKSSLFNMIKKPYIKKKIYDSKFFENSLKRNSLQMQNLMMNKKRPLILNVNLQKNLNKTHLKNLKICWFQKIIKNNGFLYILRFLDYYDIINILKTKNKKMLTLINIALTNTYYFEIKNSILKFNNIIELLKCYLVKYQIKNTLKIDLVLNVRFINNKYNYYADPIYFQLIYLYNYFKKIKPKNEFITREEFENNEKSLKMYDYFTYDLYPEHYFDDNSIKNNIIYISKDVPTNEKDKYNLANIQPILPFSVNDKGIINLELYTTDNGFIDPKSIKILMKSYNLDNYIKMLNSKSINNPRISEYEELCVHWKKINLYENHIKLIKKFQKLFSPYFKIVNIFFENIGVYIFKIYLKAIKKGEINDKKKIGIKIKIKERNEYIENEIRKNNLLFERRDIFEIRNGDVLIYYFCMK